VKFCNITLHYFYLILSQFNNFSLVLCSNTLTDHGLCALAKALHINPCLKQLYIWGNEMKSEACQVCLVYIY